MATSGQEDSLLHIVECDICTEIMDHPLALACLHHFCEACSKKLQRVHEDGVTGVHCPQCRKFTSENKIQHSFLMNNLVEMFHKKQLKHGHDQNVEKMPNCKQCNSQEVVSICKTCEIELCSNCKTGHLNIPVCQNHKIVDAYDDSDITLSITEDEFCPKHPSNLVKYNCVTCDKAVCADCKILEHDEHKTEGIDKTIDRMVQQSKQNLKAITTKKDQYEKLLDEVNSFQEKCLLNHDKTKQNIETHTQNVSCIIQKCSQKIVDKENKGFAAISDAINMKRAELGYQITSRENIITEVNTVIGMTTGLPLLTTLKESDFTAKYVDPIVEINSFTDIPSVQFKPEDQPNENYIEQLACQLFGIAKTAQKDEQGKEKVPVYDRSSQDADKMALFAIAKKTMVVKVSSRNIETACQRLCYFRGQFWCPHSKNGSNKINVFNNSLNLIHTLYLDKVNWPYAVSPISANQLIVAAGNGLYGVTVDSAIVKQLITGNFVDVQSNKDITVALEKVQAGNDKIYVFANKDEPIQESSFELDNDIGTTIALSDSHVWVSSYHSTLTKAKSYLTRYDAMGNNLSQVGAYGKNKPGELYDPRLCLADANGSILVADHWNYRLQVLDSAERWNIVGKIKGVERPLDVKLTSDGCLCVLWYNKAEYGNSVKIATSGPEDSLLHIVECDICTEIMDHPLALACLHHFCEACSKKLQIVREDGVAGVHCPQCRKFTSDNQIQQEVVLTCKSCEMELCSNCKTGHLNIPVCQNHKIVDANDDSDIKPSIAEDDFCLKHPSNHVKYNCVACDITVCADCKVLEHDEHKTEGIDKTIDRMIQQSKQNLKAITTKKDEYKKLFQEVNSFKEKCLVNHDKTKQNIETHTQNVSCIIQKRSQEIVDKENKAYTAISDAIDTKRAELGYQITRRENMITEVNTVIGTTAGLPLLTTLKEICHKKFKIYENDFCAKYVDPIVEMNSFTEVPSVQFKPEDQPNENYIEQLACQIFEIAKTAQKDEEVKEKVQVYDRSSRDADKMALSAIAKKTMVVKVSSGNIETSCERFCYFREQFWCPHSKNETYQINVFNNCLKLIHTLYLDKVKWPHALSPISANQLIVAAGNGLYVVTVDSAIVKQLITGNFVDVQSNKDIIVALEKVQAGNDKIYVFANKDEPIQESSFELDNDIGTTIALSDSHVWVSAYYNSFIKAKSYLTRYDVIGNNLSQAGSYGKNKPGELYDPRLCLADANGSILIADHWNHRLQVLDSAERWNVVEKIKGIERPLDVKLTSDGCLCVLWYNKYDGYHLTLYKP